MARVACNAIGDSVRDRQDAIVRIGRDDAFDPAEGALLSNALAALVAPHFDALGGLIATGGETARAMLAAANVGSLELVREIEAGVALGRPSDGNTAHRSSRKRARSAASTRCSALTFICAARILNRSRAPRAADLRANHQRTKRS